MVFIFKINKNNINYITDVGWLNIPEKYFDGTGQAVWGAIHCVKCVLDKAFDGL